MVTFEPRKFHGESWTPAQLRRLLKLLTRKTPLDLVALKLGRTPSAVKKKSLELRSAGADPGRRRATAMPRGASRRRRTPVAGR